MSILSIRYFTVFVIIFSLGISVCEAQPSGRSGGTNRGKGLFGIFSGKKSSSRIKAPKTVGQVKKEQEKKEKKFKEDYVKSLAESQKRTIKIQSPDVQDRMKQNQKEIIAREKAKKKKTSSSARKAERKYKK
jgi:hypothetical protein